MTKVADEIVISPSASLVPDFRDYQGSHQKRLCFRGAGRARSMLRTAATRGPPV